MCGNDGIFIPESTCDNCGALLNEIRMLRDLLDQIEARVALKQDKLTAGDNINITLENVISAVIEAYTAGENITINGKEISAIDTKYSAGTGISISGTNAISAERNAGNTYTKAEVDALLANLEHPTMKEVTTLPATGETNVIYLVPSGTGHDMYVWDATNARYVPLGRDEVDLSDYSKMNETVNNITRSAKDYTASRADGTIFTFDGSAVAPVNPSTTPTTNGAIWITT